MKTVTKPDNRVDVSVTPIQSNARVLHQIVKLILSICWDKRAALMWQVVIF